MMRFNTLTNRVTWAQHRLCESRLSLDAVSIHRAQTRVLRTRKAYAILDRDGKGGSWSQGGCRIAAEATVKAVRALNSLAEVWVLTYAGRAQHFLTKVGDKYLDIDGIASGDEVMKSMSAFHDWNKDDVQLAPMSSNIDSKEIPSSPRAVRLLSQMILAELNAQR